MATRVNDIVAAYCRATEDLENKHLELSDALRKTLAYDAIPADLKTDEHTVLTGIDNVKTSFLLYEMGPATLVSRLTEMGYKIKQSDENENYIKAEKDTEKGKLAFTFKLDQIHSVLIVPDGQPEPEVKSFVEELYSKTGVEKEGTPGTGGSG